jgi:hypothetical protein
MTHTLFVDVSFSGMKTLNEFTNDFEAVNQMIKQSGMVDIIDNRIANANPTVAMLFDDPNSENYPTEEDFNRWWNEYIDMIVQAAINAGWHIEYNR